MIEPDVQSELDADDAGRSAARPGGWVVVDQAFRSVSVELKHQILHDLQCHAPTPLPSQNLPPTPTHRALTPNERVDALLKHQKPRSPQPSRNTVERDGRLLAGSRRLTSRAFDALDEVGDWMLGR